MPTTRRPLRVDAKRNYDLLISAAKAEFTEAGAAASLDAIAKRAGVGIGTLYRHFPSRDDLIAKVLHAGTLAIVALGKELVDDPDPADALQRWLRELVDQTTSFRGLTAALANGYVSKDKTELCTSCVYIEKSGAVLLERAQAAGEIRPDAEMKELILTAHSAAWIAEQTKDPQAVDRLLGILFDGLRVINPPPRKRQRA